MERVIKIQQELKCPKNQYNKFGGYKYRSCEDILEAVKPLLKETKTTLVINDELVQIGERYYIKATATLYGDDGTKIISNDGFAREEETKKGQDGSQITGASSSYARKYALNGLFLIDDVKDSDSTNTGEEKKIDKNQIKKIKELVEEDNFDAMLNYYKIKKLEDMSFEDAKALIERKENAD